MQISIDVLKYLIFAFNLIFKGHMFLVFDSLSQKEHKFYLKVLHYPMLWARQSKCDVNTALKNKANESLFQNGTCKQNTLHPDIVDPNITNVYITEIHPYGNYNTQQ